MSPSASDQVPLVVDNWLPTVAVPVMDGTAELTGTELVTADQPVVLVVEPPFPSLAVTTSRRCLCASEVFSV